MRDKFVTWGELDGTRRLFAFELDAEDARITRRVVPAAASTDELMQTILNAWNNHATMTYPADTAKDVIGLTTTGTIVPEGASVDDKVRVASAEREWPFEVVSARLRKQFRDELEEIQDVVHGLEKFEESVFERLKGTWNKVQQELNNKVIRYEHTQGLRKLSDELFAKLKVLRRGKDKEVRSASKELRKTLRTKLVALQGELEAKKDLRGLFNRLKSLQQEINKAQLSRDDRHALRKQIDELFKATKSEIDATGADAGALSQQRERLEKRLQGLEHAIKRMKHSLHRDNQDIFYENKRVQRAGNQLAEQLGAAKLAMLGQKSESKQTKLDDMLATEADLRKRLDKLIKREEKAIAKKQAAAQQKAQAVAVASSDEGAVTPTRQRSSMRVPRQLIADAATAVALPDALTREEPAESVELEAAETASEDSPSEQR